MYRYNHVFSYQAPTQLTSDLLVQVSETGDSNVVETGGVVGVGVGVGDGVGVGNGVGREAGGVRLVAAP